MTKLPQFAQFRDSDGTLHKHHQLVLMVCEAIKQVFLTESDCLNNMYFNECQSYLKHAFMKPQLMGIIDSINYINSCDERGPAYYDQEVLATIGWTRVFKDPGVTNNNHFITPRKIPLSSHDK